MYFLEQLMSSLKSVLFHRASSTDDEYYEYLDDLLFYDDIRRRENQIPVLGASLCYPSLILIENAIREAAPLCNSRLRHP